MQLLFTAMYRPISYSQAILELKIVLRMIESIRRHGVHRMRRRRSVEAVMRVRLRPGQLAVAILLRRSHQKDRSQGQGLTGTSYALSFVHVARIYLA